MKLQCTLKLSNANMRREKAGEGEGPLATDLKFTGQLHLAKAGNFIDEHAQALLEGMYNAEGELRTTDFAAIKIKREIAGAHAELKADLTGQLELENPEMRKPLKFDGDVNNITLTPAAGRQIEISLRLQVHPSEEQLARIGHLLNSEVKLTLHGGLVKAATPDEEEEEEEEPA